jgi:hypothetical protein
VSGSGSLSSTRTRRVTMERLRSRQLKIWMSVPPARHSLPKRDFFPIGSNLSRPSSEWAPRRRRAEKADAQNLRRIPSAGTIACLMGMPLFDRAGMAALL